MASEVAPTEASGSRGELGIGVVGLGYAGAEHVGAFHRHPESFVAAVCEVRRESAEKVVAEQGIECPIYREIADLIDDPEVKAVVIATPNDLHAVQAVQTLRTGKSLLLEKPPALTISDLNEIEATLSDTRAICEIDMLLRWHPMCRAIKEQIGSGALGEILSIETEILIGELEMPEPDWERRAATGGDLHLAVACHALDQALWLMPSDPIEVWSASTRRSPVWEFDTFATTQIRFLDGALARVTASVEAKMPYEFNVRVFGSRGAIVNNSMCLPEVTGQEMIRISQEVVDANALPFDRSADEFLRALREPASALASFADVKPTFATAFAAARACQERGPIGLEPDAQP